LKNEQRLLLAVIKDKTEKEQIELNELFNKEINWGYIAGQLYHHRLSGYFYNGLTKEQLPGEIHIHFTDIKTKVALMVYVC
jgi:hypothetical protein